jgi:tRNA A-37 threonylcarbamoyl transferase component Bud32/tetratricopeptide (TPR) repeat protein
MRHLKFDELFTHALALENADRQAFLRAECAGDQALFDKLESLLRADAKAENDLFLEKPAVLLEPEFTTDSVIGQNVGRFKIVRELGAGGMGAVYLAKRADGEFEQQVAVKFLRRALFSGESKRRFLQERQILAKLKHPFIAQLIDGGATVERTPYLVMEYVEGDPITVYVERNNLTVNETLELFRKVCQAVSFAHQNFIVHRDLKPDNILIAKDGTPKLLDFGIAKLLSETDVQSTVTQLQAFTPAYAAPEQISGESITAASDVYSLGVILYELLTGIKPRRERASAQSARALPVVREAEPARSASIGNLIFTNGAPANGNSKFRTQSLKFLRGELNTIVIKALKNDAARRYASVENFAEDVRRHQVGLPIAARPDTFLYRAGKFIERHRIGVFAAALVALAVIFGVAATARQSAIAERERSRAERRAENLRKISNSLVVELHDEIIKLPGSLPARRLLLQRGMEQLDALAAESEGNAQLQDELAYGYYNLGEIPDLSLAEVERNHQKAVAIYQSLLEKEPENLKYRLRLAHGFSRLANVQKMRCDIVGALDYSRQVVRMLEGVVAAAPTDAEFQLNLFTSYYETAMLLNSAGDARAGLEVGWKAFALGENILRSAPDNKNYPDLMAASRMSLAASLMILGDYQSAVAHVTAARSATAARYAEEPENVIHRYGMWATNRRLGEIYAAAGTTAAALESLETALRFIETLAAESPNDDGYRRNTSFTYLTIGQTLLRAQEPGKAAPYLRRALQLSESILAKDLEKGETIADLAAIHAALGEILTRTKKRPEGLRHYRESLVFYEKTRAANSGSRILRRDYAETLFKFGIVLIRQDELAEALKYLQQNLDLREIMSAEKPGDEDLRHAVEITRSRIFEIQNR